MEAERGEADQRNDGDAAAAAAAVPLVSASDNNHDSSSDDQSADDSVLRYGDPSSHPDALYDDNADDEDEAYVYRHLRGGVEEDVPVRRDDVRRGGGGGGEGGRGGGAAAAAAGAAAGEALERAHVLKPRSSDAVLSCPCCFNIVCMDCQRHEQYRNQYRAMFVMNIGVDWRRRLVYDESRRGLVEGGAEAGGLAAPAGSGGPTAIPRDDRPADEEEGDECYFSVYCDNCLTEVAALNMADEVYHFYGCLASG